MIAAAAEAQNGRGHALQNGHVVVWPQSNGTQPTVDGHAQPFGTGVPSDNGQAAPPADEDDGEGASKADRTKAAAEALRQWNAAAPANPDHPYLARKQVAAHGLRCDATGRLLVPLYEANSGRLTSLQFISGSGDKLTLAGARTKGCCYPLGGAFPTDPPTRINIAEGFATAATIAAADDPSALTVAAYCANNLSPVALALHQRYPNAPILVFGDDDYLSRQGKEPYNPGRIAAEAAAAKVDGRAYLPTFPPDADPTHNDWNDLCVHHGGADAVRKQIAAIRGGPRVTNVRAITPDALGAHAFVIPDWLPAGEVTLLSGHGEAGKTELALTIAADLVFGRKLLGFTTTSKRVLFYSGEDDALRVFSRLTAICTARGRALSDLDGRFFLLDVSCDDEAALFREDRRNGGGSATPRLAWLQDAVRRSKPDLIIIDSLTDAFHGNENDRTQVKQFVNLLKSLARIDGAAVLLLGHVNKATAQLPDSTQAYSGSSHWHNAVRARLYYRAAQAGEVCRDPQFRAGYSANLRVLERQKNNYADTRGALRAFAAWDDAQRVLVLSEVESGGVKADYTGAILRVIAEARTRGEAVPVNATSGTSAVSRVRAAVPELTGRNGARAIRDLLHKLCEDGLLGREAQVGSSRHKVDGYAVTPEGVERLRQLDNPKF